MTKDRLLKKTKSHYEDLIGEIGEKYVYERWGNHPIKRSHYRQTYKTLESVLLNDASANQRILEVGPGPGTWTNLLLPYASDIHLFDLSEEMLKVAKSKFEKESKITKFMQGDFFSHRLADRYDLVFSVRAIEYMEDKRGVVEKCFNLLSPNGRLIIVTKNPGWRDKRRTSAPDVAGIQTNWIDWEMLRDIFVETGLSDVYVRPVAFGSYYRPLNNLMGIGFSDFMHRLNFKKDMHRRLDWLTESYIVSGRRPD